MPIKLTLDEINEWKKWNPRFSEDDHNIKILVDAPDAIDTTEKLTAFINAHAAKFHWLAEKPKEQHHEDNRKNHSRDKEEDEKTAAKLQFAKDEKQKKAREAAYLVEKSKFYGLQGDSVSGRINHSETRQLRKDFAAQLLVNFPQYSQQIRTEFADFLK